MTQRLSRKALAERVGLAAAAFAVAGADAGGGGAATLVDSAETAGAPGVVTAAAAGTLTVALDGGGTVRAAIPPIERRLRRGDRVVVEGGERDRPVATPLFRQLEGRVEAVDRSSLTIGGTSCRIDRLSHAYDARSARRELIGAVRHSPAATVGALVGALCIENTNESTLTAQAVYLLG
jgi:hypothetical protein